MKNIDTNKILVSNKVFFRKKCFKYLIGCKDDKIKPLCIFLPKMNAHRSDELLEKYNEICEKVKNSIKKEFNNKPVYK